MSDARILPALGEEYDRVFTIPQQDIDKELLLRSGYRDLHRPYFAMKGSTHTRCEINPCKKTVVDAGKTDAETTSFQAFLKLFD